MLYVIIHVLFCCIHHLVKPATKTEVKKSVPKSGMYVCLSLHAYSITMHLASHMELSIIIQLISSQTVAAF